MDEQSIEAISLELAILVRRITAITTYKKIRNLDRAAYLLLEHLNANGSTGVKALADEFQLDISTVSRQAAALEKKGYVTRIPDPIDGRAFSFEITDWGATELTHYKHERLLKLKDILHNWSDEECKMFGELLRKFNRTTL